MTSTLLALFSELVDGAPRFLLVGEDGAVADRGVLALDPPQPIPAERTIVVVPGADVNTRWVELPTRSEAQARAAALLLAQDHLAVPRERIHLALGEAAMDGTRVVAAVDPELLRGWLQVAGEMGLMPHAVVPDHLMLPPPETGAVMAPSGGLAAVRAPRLAFTAEPELAPTLLGDMPVTELTDREAIERMMAGVALAPPINLLQGAFAVRHRFRFGWGSVRRAAALAGGIALVSLLIQLVEAWRYDLAARRLELAVEAEVREALPRATRIVNPQAQLRERLAEVQTGSGPGALGAVAGLFRALDGVPPAELDGLAYLPDGTVRATVSYAAYTDLEALRSALSGAGLAVEEGASRTEGSRLVSDLTLRPRA